MKKKKDTLKWLVLWIAEWAILGAMFVYFVPVADAADGYVFTENGEIRELVSLGEYTTTAYDACRKCCGKTDGHNRVRG